MENGSCHRVLDGNGSWERCTFDVLIICRQRLNVLQKTKPVLYEEVCVRDNLGVDFIKALAMEINGNVEAIGNVELNDEKETARHKSMSNITFKTKC